MNKHVLSYMSTNAKLPKGLPPYPISIFSPTLRKDISMIYQILGYESDQMVDETIMGFMTMITPPTEDLLVRFDYCQYFSDMMDTEFSLRT